MGSSLFDDMKKSMEEAVAFGEGDQTKGRRKNVAIKALQVFTPEEIKQLREQLQFTQRVFAQVLGVSTKTVEAWEKGTNTPSGSSRRLLEIYWNHLDIAEQAVTENV